MVMPTLTQLPQPAATAVPIVLTPEDEAVLLARIRAGRTAQRDVLRAKIVMAAAAGETNAAIAAGLGVHLDTVRTWRGCFARKGLDGLRDLPRSGRPKVFTDLQSAEVKALACELPAESGLPLSRWSHTELAREAVARAIVESISASTVRRWLCDDAIKPWQHRSWIFPRDRQFADKAARVLDLYARTWQGRELGPDEYVISADEKSQLQALRRRHPGLPAGACQVFCVRGRSVSPSDGLSERESVGELHGEGVEGLVPSSGACAELAAAGCLDVPDAEVDQFDRRLC